jgi:hypothetical protein
MNPKRLKEVLAAHTDRMLRGQSEPDQVDELASDEDGDELAALLGVAERVKSALKPVAPAGKFENQLKRELLTAAHLRRAEGYVAPNPERDLLVLMGIVGFIISLASVLITLKIQKII